MFPQEPDCRCTLTYEVDEGSLAGGPSGTDTGGMGSGGGGFSQDPNDRLIRELIDSGRSASLAEIEAIRRHLSIAPYDRRVLPVPLPLRGMEYLGRILGDREESLFRHLVGRVLDDGQWVYGTTAAEYLEDLRNAIDHEDARLVVYRRRGESNAAVLAPNIVGAGRRGPDALPYIFVVYSADRGIIVSGYQVSGQGTISIGERANWLR